MAARTIVLDESFDDSNMIWIFTVRQARGAAADGTRLERRAGTRRPKLSSPDFHGAAYARTFTRNATDNFLRCYRAQIDLTAPELEGYFL